MEEIDIEIKDRDPDGIINAAFRAADLNVSKEGTNVILHVIELVNKTGEAVTLKDCIKLSQSLKVFNESNPDTKQ